MDDAVNHPDPAFPLFHPRPAKGWIGGPCGLGHRDGRFHVFFQFNPDSARQEGICWGHLSSPDLLRWTEESVALRPQPAGPDELGSLTMPADPRVTAVRDPFLFRFQGLRFALQGAGLASGHAAVLLYSVDDLRVWNCEGIWLSTEDPLAAAHLPAAIWECPQLVRVPDSSGAETWLFMASLSNSGNDDHPGGVGYLLGSLAADAVTGLPVFVPVAGGKADLGPDFHAAQILPLPDRALLWGWSNEVAGNEAAGNEVAGNEVAGAARRAGRSQAEIDEAGWAGVLTFPRRLFVHGGALAVEPAAEITAYRGRRCLKNAAGTLHLPRHAEALVTGGEGGIRLVLASAGGRRTVFADTVAGGDELRIFIDSSIVEVYRHGSVPATVRAYPAAGEDWQLELPHGAAADAWELHQPGG
ncbi:glycoside hydrolase family 32 protein [Arthrobacter sp. PAMC25564]|uniref:glycoside hydrolase family 32 protein n=1 Tax=Arthrobacter sp. PAMC25564 TaxID=2565366 RepID=UPI0010A2A7F1|nr:glycoside hydrolase family 32 protein [Arthrobacter sp. PAMC25564]QCB96583.1 glycoside hydrolase family 32 protein [Arthrobacter sp. PAMC25564]